MADAWGGSWSTAWGDSWGDSGGAPAGESITGVSRGRGVSFVEGVSMLNRMVDQFITDGVGN